MRRRKCLLSGEKESSDNRERRARGKERVGSKSAQEKHICWKCDKEGHLKKQCLRWNKGIKPEEHSVGRRENTTDERRDSDDVMLLVSEASFKTNEDRDERWLVDSGCTFHMTPRRELFETFSDKEGVSKCENGESYNCSSKGSRYCQDKE